MKGRKGERREERRALDRRQEEGEGKDGREKRTSAFFKMKCGQKKGMCERRGDMVRRKEGGRGFCCLASGYLISLRRSSVMSRTRNIKQAFK